MEHTLAKELCEITKSGDPISVLGTKMEELPSDMRVLLKELLRVFSKVRGRDEIGSGGIRGEKDRVNEGRWKEGRKSVQIRSRERRTGALMLYQWEEGRLRVKGENRGRIHI